MIGRVRPIVLSLGISLLIGGGPLSCFAQVTMSMPKIDLPDKQFYSSFGDYFRGEFSRAGRSFRQMSVTAYKDANGLFLDSICYWSMQAECHYQLGELRQAVELHEQALKLYLDWVGWSDRTQFPPKIQAASNAWRQANVTWGTPTRTTQYANIPNTFQFLFGRLNNDQVIRQGGVVEPPNLKGVDLASVHRCIALSLYRRHQLKGILCSRDPLTNRLIASFATSASNDGTLAAVWNGVLLGIAQSSAGKFEQAIGTLKNSLQFNGGMDHTLTAIALLETGNVALSQGNLGDASRNYLEASYSAAVFKQYDLIAEALVGANRCHLRSRPGEVFGQLAEAIRWADRERADALQTTLLVELLKDQTELGQADEAKSTLSLIRRAASGNDLNKTALAAPVAFSSAVFKFQSGDVKAGESELANAMDVCRRFSPRDYQIQFVDQALTARRIGPRDADLVYSELLRDPIDTDWLDDPCAAICFLMTDHVASLQLWFDQLAAERRLEPAFGVADQIRRHRYYSGLPMGGRLHTLRWMMEAPPELLAETTLKQRADWLQRFPEYARLSTEAADAIRQLRELPLVCEANSEPAKRQRELFDQLTRLTTSQEQILTGIALHREPADLIFAKPLPVNASEPLLPSKTMLLSFMETGQGVAVISVTERVINFEALVNRRDLDKAVGELLRNLGNSNERNDIEISELKDDVWPVSAGAIHKLLFPNRQPTYWNQFDDIVVIPDGTLWYAPFELILGEPTAERPLNIRYCPMVSMAIPNGLPPAKFPKTLLVGRRSADKALQTRFDEQLASLKKVIPNVEQMTSAGKTPFNLLSAVADRLIAWADDWKPPAKNLAGFSWIPDTNVKSGNALADWLLLPWSGPRLLVAPQFSTAAGNGLRSDDSNGANLFQLSSHAIACGGQTLLISRWNTGDSSSFQASIEFVAAAGDLPASEAWRQTVEKIKQLPIDAGPASRIKAPPAGIGDRKCDHPFFWAGYLLIDTGWRPAAEEPPTDPK